jgi:hypothetical protein
MPATRRAGDQGGLGVAVGEQPRSPGVVGHRPQRWRAVPAGDLGQLTGGVAGRLEVADRQHDLDVGGEQLRPPEPLARLGDDTAAGPPRPPRPCPGPAAGAPAPAAALGPPAGLLVGVLGPCEVTGEPVQLPLPVAGRAGGVLVCSAGEPLQRPLGLLDRLWPGPVQLQDLGPVNQALTREGDHVRLLATPRRQRLGPLGRATQLGDLLADLDHPAVDRAGHDG